jgi:hypothetical protein
MEFRSGSIFIRQSDQTLETGAVINGHTHNFDHTTFFTAGKWKVEVKGQVFDGDGKPMLDEQSKPLTHKVRERIIQAGKPFAWFLIEATMFHTLTLLEGPGCYACVYSHRVEDGDVTPEYNGWHDAYV